jgi:hypothetical protein
MGVTAEQLADALSQLAHYDPEGDVVVQIEGTPDYWYISGVEVQATADWEGMPDGPARVVLQAHDQATEDQQDAAARQAAIDQALQLLADAGVDPTELTQQE